MKIKHIKFVNEPFVSPQAIIRKQHFYNFKIFLNYFIASLFGGLVFFIFYTCITSGNDTQKLNKCLQKHSLNYCNKVVK